MPAYELRTYQIAPGGMETVEAIFRDLVLPMLPEYRMTGIGFWASADDATLHYVVEHSGEEVIDENWQSFHADPRWQPGLEAHEQGRTVVTHTDSVHLRDIKGLPPL